MKESRRTIPFFLLACLSLGWLTACDDDDDSATEGLRSTRAASTAYATNLTSTTATLTGPIQVGTEGLSAGDAVVVAYDTAKTFASGWQQAATLDLSVGTFSADLTGLLPASTYYYHTIVRRGSETYDGNTLSFKTGASSVAVATAVDLGLSVKWASFNLGATAPSGYGNYYAWGELLPKNYYSDATYAHGTGNALADFGTDISGTPRDAATQLWGAGWRLPTQAEFEELRQNCRIHNETVNRVAGVRIVGPNDSIFVPFAGKMVMWGAQDARSAFYLWSATLSSQNPADALTAKAISNTDAKVYWFDIDLGNQIRRSDGLSIRPVHD